MNENIDSAPSNTPSDLPMISGKLVISCMLGVAVSLAAFAWWARYSQSQQVLDTWGKEAVVAIRKGERVELLTAEPNGDSDAVRQGVTVTVPTDGSTTNQTVRFESVTEISKTPGLIHARHHLVHQKGFEWEAARNEDCEPNWKTGLRFTHKGDVATMLFDFNCNRAYLVEKQAEVTMRPIIADALTDFFQQL